MAHDVVMKSRVYPTYKTKYRVGNWPAYERALVQRGDVTLWLSADARDAWRPSPSGQPGGQQRFSDLAITTTLTLRLVFRLPLRQAEGFVRSVLSSMDVDLEAPDQVLALFAVDQAAYWQAAGRQRVGTSAASDSACVTVAETCTTAIRRRRERPGAVKMSSQPICVFTRPACMAGVLVSRPNRNALCGRMKL